MKIVVFLLALVAAVLAVLRWGLPYGTNVYGQKLFDEGRYAEAKDVFAFVERYWQGEYDADARMDKAETKIIEGFIRQGDDESLAVAAERAKEFAGENAPAKMRLSCMKRL